MSRLSAHLEHRQLVYRLAAAALVFATSLVIGYFSYRNVVFTTDENSYLFQASAFSDWVVRRAPPPPPLDQLLHGGMNVIDPKLGWFSRYPPGHALWLLPGLLFGAPRLMSALAAALSMWWLTGAARTLRAPWWAAALFLLLSPYFLYMHGTLLSHTSGMAAVSLMLWAYLLWREGRGPRLIAIAGAAWAFLYLDRPYTAALLVPAFALDALRIWYRRKDRATFHALVVFGLAAMAGPLLFLVYNHAVTGNAMPPPYLLYDPAAALGFHGRHTWAVGWSHLQANVQLLDAWILGTPWALAALGLCFFVCAASSLAWLAGLAAVTIIGGYLFFYHHGVNSCGPYYYFETLPFWVLIWLLFVQRVRRAKHATWAGWALSVLLLFVAASSLPFTWRLSRKFPRRTEREAALKAAIQTAPPGSVVAMVNENYSRGDDLRTRLRPNLKGLDSDPLVINSLEDYDFITASFFPDRKFFRLRNTKTPHLEPLPDTRVPYRVRIPGSSTHNMTGQSNGSGDEATWCRRASADDAAGLLAFGRPQITPPGRLKAVFDLALSNVPNDQPVVLRVSIDHGATVLATRTVWGSSERGHMELPFHLSTAAAVEPSVSYGGAGEVTFWSMAMEEADAPSTSDYVSPP